jgi:predicted nucleic acid-binding protein
MNGVFADTAYWIALTNVQDVMYGKARSYGPTLKAGTLLTSADVLTEYLNYLPHGGTHFRQKASGNVDSMLRSRKVRIIPPTHETFLAGLDLYRARIDKGYSLTDCISMQIMRREGVSDVLTSDKHFEQEGVPGTVPGLLKDWLQSKSAGRQATTLISSVEPRSGPIMRCAAERGWKPHRMLPL